MSERLRRRGIRTILVIDEAHNHLSQKNIFLQRMIREGRSKGVVVFFASQSPNDYQQEFFNFQELLEFAYIFQCEGVTATSVQRIRSAVHQCLRNRRWISLSLIDPTRCCRPGD